MYINIHSLGLQKHYPLPQPYPEGLHLHNTPRPSVHRKRVDDT